MFMYKAIETQKVELNEIPYTKTFYLPLLPF